MKIRTDFVTNSSSYSSSTIIIDNPVLLEILKKYDEMGAFVKDRCFSIGKREHFIRFNHYFDKDPSTSPVFAFSVNDEDFSYKGVPSRLDQVVEFILTGIEDDEYVNDTALFKKLKSETQKKREDILSGYKKVIWEKGASTNEDDDFEGITQSHEKLYYDPVKGEDYSYNREVIWSGNEDIEEGTKLDEYQKLNGKVSKNITFKREEEE